MGGEMKAFLAWMLKSTWFLDVVLVAVLILALCGKIVLVR